MFQSVTKRFDPIPVVKSKTSETVPDMSFTPREIIQKFSRGEKVPLGFQGLYDSEDSVLDANDPAIWQEDPTRDPNFDFGDYTEEKIALEQRQKAAKRRSAAEASSDKKRKASSEELSASDAMRKETTSGLAEDASKGETN